MDWQFYMYCRNVSMYATRLLSWIGSSTRIVGMFLCIKLVSCHGLAVCYLLYIIIIIVIVIIIILCIRQPDPKYHVKYCYHFSSIVPIVVVSQKLLHFNLLLWNHWDIWNHIWYESLIEHASQKHVIKKCVSCFCRWSIYFSTNFSDFISPRQRNCEGV